MLKVLFFTFLWTTLVITFATAATSASEASEKPASGSINKAWNFGGIGLSTVLNDVITELNSTLQAQNSKARSGKSNFDGMYGMWNPSAGAKVDVLSLIPTLLIVGLGIMLLPVLLTCLTQVVAPLTYSNGRRKRDVGSDGLAFHPSLMLGMLSTLESAMEKFGRF